MDLSIAVFDLRDAIEELREERAELLKRIEALEAQSRLISQSGEGGDDEDDSGRRSDQKNQSSNETAPLVCPSGKSNPQNEETDRHQWLHRQVERQNVQKSVECIVHTDILPEGGSR
jgi:hypothetical protein